MILQKISATSFRLPGPYLPSSKLKRYYPITLRVWALRIIMKLLDRHKEELNKHVALYLERIIQLDKRDAAKKLSESLVGGRQVTDLPEAIQQNIFLKHCHKGQIELEKRAISGEEPPSIWGYTPFNWKLPFSTKLVIEGSDESFIPKMILKNKIGRVSILIKEHSGIGVHEAFIYATRFSDDPHRDYREVVFIVTVEVLVNNFAALFRRGEKLEDFFEWADNLTSLIETLDWNRFQRTFSRDLFYDTYDRLDGLREEILVDFYENFDDTPEGKVLRLLRLTRSPRWKWGHNALEELIKIKEEVPQTVIDTVTWRLMALTRHHKDTFAFKAAEALKEFSEKISVSLHESIIERLLELLDTRYKSTLGYRVKKVIEALTAFYNQVGIPWQSQVFEAIIRVYLEVDDLYGATRQALTQIWSRTPTTIIEGYLERYQSYLVSEDMSLVLQGLRFYSGLGEVLEPHIINEVTERVLKQGAYSEDVAIAFCTFTRDWDGILPEEYSDGVLERLVDFIEQESEKVKKQCLRTIGYTKRTYSNSSTEIQENIVRILISHIDGNNEAFQHLAAESLSFLIETIPETLYDEIAVCLLVYCQLFRDKLLDKPAVLHAKKALQFLSNRISNVELSGMIETCLRIIDAI